MAAAEELLRELELESRSANVGMQSQGSGGKKGGGATKKKGKDELMCWEAC